MKTAMIVCGVIFLLLAAGAYAYTVIETDSYAGGLFTDQDASAPYRYLSLPFALAGVVLLIVSATMSQKET